jgi:hypothetical protein
MLTDAEWTSSSRPNRVLTIATSQAFPRYFPGTVETREFLGPASDLKQFLERYDLLKSAREALLGIAKRYGSEHLAPRLTIHEASFPGGEAPLSVAVDLEVKDKGVLGASDNPLLRALIGVRADRIRECAVCRRLYWAPCVNSECCSQTCRKTYNRRNSRQNRRFQKRKRGVAK